MKAFLPTHLPSTENLKHPILIKTAKKPNSSPVSSSKEQNKNRKKTYTILYHQQIEVEVNLQ